MSKLYSDPEKYKQLAKPFESVEEAQKVAAAFCGALAKLREQYRIPELTVSYMLYAEAEAENESVALRGGAGWGDQIKQLRLAKDCFDREYAHAMLLMQAVVADFGAKDMLITDPDGKV